MPELRHDPIQKRWVIIASERARRPSDFQVEVTTQKQEFCPFCPTHEDKTPDEIASIREGYSAPNSPSWSVRVVPNKYPALKVEGNLDKCGDGIYDKLNGIGAHEIVIETPNHDEQMADQSVPQLTNVLKIYRDRVIDLMRDMRMLFVVVFRNYGDSAGATLAHPHSQIIGMPILPRTIEIELRSARDHYMSRERCLFCDMIRQEQNNGSRVVIENNSHLVFTPYASRFPFELMIAPRAHQYSFVQTSDKDLEALAATLKNTLQRLKRALNDPPFNMVLHMAPNSAANSVWFQEFPTIKEGYHWHIEIIPRLTKAAGFEWGTDFYINPTPPEEAAAYLRQI